MGCVIGKIEYCEHDKETAEEFTGLQDVYRKLCLGITNCDVTEARKCGNVHMQQDTDTEQICK